MIKQMSYTRRLNFDVRVPTLNLTLMMTQKPKGSHEAKQNLAIVH